jgi:hypothetical protein
MNNELNQQTSEALNQFVLDNMAFAAMSDTQSGKVYFMAKANEATAILLERKWVRG